MLRIKILKKVNFSQKSAQKRKFAQKSYTEKTAQKSEFI